MGKREENQQKAIKGKKIYHSPELTIHGNIVSLTGGVDMGSQDMGMKVAVT